METKERIKFIKLTEKLVTPKKVATIFQGAEFLRKLPKFLQKKIMENGAKTEPYISFIVEPYSFFLAYEIIDEKKLEAMLPKDYELVDCSMFDGEKQKKCIIVGAFNVHTSVFWGNRLEIYIIARNKRTGLVSWIIHEYETNTISYDPGRGFIEPGTEHSVLTTSFKGEIILDVESMNHENKIQVNAKLKKASMKKLNKELWIEGNLSVDYGADLSEVQTKPFGLIFDPGEMDEALAINIEDVEILENTFLKGIIDKVPFEVCCFPYAQHFYTTTIPMEHNIVNENDLENAIVEINLKDTRQKAAKALVQAKKPCPGYCYSYGCKHNCQLLDRN